MDLDDPHHVRVDVHLKYAGKSEKGANYKVKPSMSHKQEFTNQTIY